MTTPHFSRTTRPVRHWICFAAVLAGLATIASAAWPLPIHAQPKAGAVGIGAQVGRPSGLTGKLYRHAQLAYDLSLVWNLRDFAFVESHRTHEWPIPNSLLHLLLGPGVFAGLDVAPGDSKVTLGISGALGLNFFRERFEVFLQATPRMRLYPATQARLGGSVGLRYFF